METGNIAINKQYLLKAYREAKPSQKEFMKQLFGTDTLTSSVMERVKTFQDAVNELGDDNSFVKQYNMLYSKFGDTMDADIIAYLKLRIITAALNEGWEPKFTEDEYRYYPWFELTTKEEIDDMTEEDKGRVVCRSGIVFMGASYVSSSANPSHASRLVLKGSDLAEYAGKQFLDIWADFVFKIGDTDK